MERIIAEDRIEFRKRAIEVIKDRVLDLEFEQYNLDLDLCNCHDKKTLSKIRHRQTEITYEIVWRMQDYEDLLCREGSKLKLNYQYE